MSNSDPSPAAQVPAEPAPVAAPATVEAPVTAMARAEAIPASIDPLLAPVLATPVVPRVGQLDASLLDAQLLGMFKEQLTDALSLFKTPWAARYDAELSTLLGILVPLLALASGTSHGYGLSLQNLRYAATTPHIAAHGILAAVAPYAWSRLRAWVQRTRRESVDRTMSKAETAWTVISLVTLVRFLVTGRYRTPLERVMRLRVVPASIATQRTISLAFLHRQMLWNAFTEFLLFALPLYRHLAPRIRRILLRYFPALRFLTSSRLATLAQLPIGTCPVCVSTSPTFQTDPTHAVQDPEVLDKYRANMPVRADPCGCVYCYYCAQVKHAEEVADMDTAKEDDKVGEEKVEWTCVRCGKGVARIERA
ncbi:peroxisome assembly protein (Peroxin-2) [Allomyces arbusculus]|nr:peroxisome assembly protein (Peroxin-2) [Allomyces arbusculus]